MAILVLPVLALGSCFAYQRYNSYTHAFRLSGEVDTPDGLKTGSSIIAVTCQKALDWPRGMRTYSGGCSVRGEAPFIELGGGRHVIMLLAQGPTGQNTDIYDLAAKALGRYKAEFFVAAPNWTGSAELKTEDIPTLITFADIADPASAKVVFAGGREMIRRVSPDGRSESFHAGEPKALVDAFAETFGPGFAFRRAIIEMAPKDTPVTRGIEKRFPFLVTHREKLRRIQSDMPPRFQPHFHYFIRENL
jgi:hypothetical protein